MKNTSKINPYNPLRKNRLNFLLFLSSTLACLILLELFLRLPMQMPYSCILYEKDDALSFKTKPNLNITFRTKEYEALYTTNNDGIREYTQKKFNKAKGQQRILTIGDSFTFGIGLNKEDTFQEKLKEKLYTILKKKVEVINAGTSGYGAAQSFEFLKMNIKGYDPDIVIFSFYNNDVLDDREYSSLTVGNGCLIRKDISRLKKFLYTHSRTYLFYKSYKNSFSIGIEPVRNALYKFRNFLVRLGLSNGAKIMYPILENHTSDELNKAWEKTLQNIQEMDNLCKQENCTFVLVYIPSRIQVNPTFREEYISRNNLNEADFDFEKPSRLLREHGRAKEMIFVDLLEKFSKVNIDDNNLQIYNEYDPHFNKNGAEVFSTVLLNKLREIYKNEE